jgi:lysophospholipase L1-like esterase
MMLKIQPRAHLFLLLLLLASLPVLAAPVTLVTLGDSLTAGDGDEEVANLGGFPPRLLSKLRATHPGSTLKNLAVSGLTSDDLINIELDPAVSALRSAPAGNLKIALVWIGSNDLFGLYNNVCDDWFKGDYPRCEHEDLENFGNNLEKMLSRLEATGARLFVALLDDQSKRPFTRDARRRGEYLPNITNDEVVRMSAQVERYNEVIRKAASQHGATTVDFFNTTLFTDETTLSSDGNHPSSTGYDRIAELWHEAITASLDGPGR